jgi:hypothetical protein
MDPLKHISEDPSSILMHYRALKTLFCLKERYKAAEILQHTFFHRLVKAMYGLAMVKNVYKWTHRSIIQRTHQEN